MFKKLIFLCWTSIAFLLFLYTFTQVDLSLTLSKISIWQTIQKSFQYIGYFDRPFSTGIFLFIVLFMFLLYLWTLFLVNKNEFSRSYLWKIILTVGTILFFSYNAFSYDLFNYIFDAKIVTHYHQNPYLYKALDFPTDPMLSFMHWTHRVYPYGPVWLVLTVPLSFLGFGYFLFTLYLFKALIFASFLASAYFLEKIANTLKFKNSLFHLVFFALNPLVLIESLVSAHNDSIMVFFTIFSFYLLVKKRYIYSLAMFLLSVGTKFVTLAIFPVYIIYFWAIKNNKLNWNLLIHICLVLMMFPVVLASQRTNFQPWYLLFVLPFASLSANRYYVFIPSIIIPFFALLNYVPYLSLGNWDEPVPTILFQMLIVSVALSVIAILINYIRINVKKN